MDKPMITEEELNMLLESIDESSRKDADELMEVNHRLIKRSRAVIYRIREMQTRFMELTEDLIEAQVRAAKGISDMYGDWILIEHGFETISDIEDDEDDE